MTFSFHCLSSLSGVLLRVKYSTGNRDLFLLIFKPFENILVARLTCYLGPIFDQRPHLQPAVMCGRQHDGQWLCLQILVGPFLPTRTRI